jgi:hypothetical protein
MQYWVSYWNRNSSAEIFVTDHWEYMPNIEYAVPVLFVSRKAAEAEAATRPSGHVHAGQWIAPKG